MSEVRIGKGFARLVSGVLLLLCQGCDGSVDGETASMQNAVRGGAVTLNRPEIGLYSTGFGTCGGTLVAPR